MAQIYDILRDGFSYAVGTLQDVSIFLILLVPLLSAILCGVIGKKRVMERTSVCAAFITALSGMALVSRVVAMPPGTSPVPRLGGLLYADALSAYLVLIICFISLMITLYSLGYIGYEYSIELFGKAKLRQYYFLLNLFVFTMLLAAVANNLGVLWVAVEATTLASAFLVGFYNREESIEAAWKYLIIGSVGITFALFGTVLVYFSALSVFKALGSPGTLNWTDLVNPSIATQMDPHILKLAFIFVLIGYGTKAGLAPMHTWLPDAHSQAPTPISALLSGVLINAAMYGILRFHHLLAASPVGPDFSSNLLLFFGLLSIAVATPFIMVQKDYKRLLAYSSMKHMGIIATGIGLGTPLAIYGALLHILNHALAKAFIFMSAGNLSLKFKTKEIALVKGIAKILPMTSALLLLGTFAIMAVPPFNLFVSEFLILSASFLGGNFLVGSLVLLLVVLAFAGFIFHISHMILGVPIKPLPPGEVNPSSFLPLSILLGLVILLGLYVPGPLHELLQQATKLVKP